jgi:hypothetical protein
MPQHRDQKAADRMTIERLLVIVVLVILILVLVGYIR